MPVLSECRIELPPAIDLRRADVSDLADAIIVAGATDCPLIAFDCLLINYGLTTDCQLINY